MWTHVSARGWSRGRSPESVRVDATRRRCASAARDRVPDGSCRPEAGNAHWRAVAIAAPVLTTACGCEQGAVPDAVPENGSPGGYDRSKSPGRGKNRLDKWVSKLRQQEQEQREKMSEAAAAASPNGSPSGAPPAKGVADAGTSALLEAPVISKLDSTPAVQKAEAPAPDAGASKLARWAARAGARQATGGAVPDQTSEVKLSQPNGTASTTEVMPTHMDAPVTSKLDRSEASAPQQPAQACTPPSPGVPRVSGGSKMQRWAARAGVSAPAPAPAAAAVPAQTATQEPAAEARNRAGAAAPAAAAAGGSKLARWAARAGAPAPTGAPAAGGVSAVVSCPARTRTRIHARAPHTHARKLTHARKHTHTHTHSLSLSGRQVCDGLSHRATAGSTRKRGTRRSRTEQRRRTKQQSKPLACTCRRDTGAGQCAPPQCGGPA